MSVSIKNTADSHKSCQLTVHAEREKKAVTLVLDSPVMSTIQMDGAHLI